MHRRTFLQATGAVTSLAFVGTACSGEDGPPSSTDEQELFVVTATFEFLAGSNRWVTFGLLEAQGNAPVEDASPQVWIQTVPTSSASEAETVAGPLEATYAPSGEVGQGIYYFQHDFDEGFYDLSVVVGDRNGSAALQAVAPENAQVPAPGSQAVSAPTATVDDDLGQFSICTAEPQCAMHEMSLEEALESGRPIAVVFATPQFCQTSICGPSVQTLEQVRDDGDWGETVFIHCEIFQDEPSGNPGEAAVPLVGAVEAWGLQSEPWFFTIDTDGAIKARLDGPMPAPVMTTMLEDLTA